MSSARGTHRPLLAEGAQRDSPLSVIGHIAYVSSNVVGSAALRRPSERGGAPCEVGCAFYITHDTAPPTQCRGR